MSRDSILSWRYLYLYSIAFRVFFGLSNSYLHPDEHFQSLQVLSNKILNYNANLPWEFESDAPARSIGILYIVYGPLLYFVKYACPQIDPISIWYLARLQNILLGWIITDMCLYRILPTKQERMKALYFVLTSYATLVYQSHCFSNCIETWLVLITICIIEDFRYIQELLDVRISSMPKRKAVFFIGVLMSLGIFNRITFPAFIIFPGFYLLKFIWLKRTMWLALISFCISSALLIALDTYLFQGSFDFLKKPLQLKNYVITPLNSLIYNTDPKNLSTHGLHPYYTHVLLNVPQILGPGVFFLFRKGGDSYFRTTPFLSVLSGLLFLSLVPHQELRFLLPILPLACCCFNINDSKAVQEKTKTRRTSPIQVIINLWYVFNAVMSILMGIFHQGGVAPALNFIYSNRENQMENNYVYIWWRTYSPPTWLLGDRKFEFEFEELQDDALVHSGKKEMKKKIIVDAKGCSYSTLQTNVKSFKKKQNKVFIVSPIASFNINNDFPHVNMTWSYSQHIGLDHLDFSNKESFRPGLAIYEIL